MIIFLFCSVNERGPEENAQESAVAPGEVLMPLISAVEHSDDEWRWWSIDSGAAVSMLSEQFKAFYKCSAEEQVMDTYYVPKDLQSREVKFR